MTEVLPRLLVLTDRAQTGRRRLAEVVGAAADGGARAVVLREKDLSRSDRERLAVALRPFVEVLLAASHPLPGGDGVHLAAGDEPPDPRPAVVGRSCHGTREVRAASTGGVDYVTVSPVFDSPSKPGYGPPLGLAGLREVTERAAVPVYALGGVTAGNAAACIEAGAHGVAVMGAVMRAPDPAGTVSELRSAVETAGARR